MLKYLLSGWASHAILAHTDFGLLLCKEQITNRGSHVC